MPTHGRIVATDRHTDDSSSTCCAGPGSDAECRDTAGRRSGTARPRPRHRLPRTPNGSPRVKPYRTQFPESLYPGHMTAQQPGFDLGVDCSNMGCHASACATRRGGTTAAVVPATIRPAKTSSKERSLRRSPRWGGVGQVRPQDGDHLRPHRAQQAAPNLDPAVVFAAGGAANERRAAAGGAPDPTSTGPLMRLSVFQSSRTSGPETGTVIGGGGFLGACRVVPSRCFEAISWW